MGEWQSTTVGELCASGAAQVQTGPFGSQLHAHEYVEDGVPVVPTEAIGHRRIDHTVLPKISDDKAAALQRHRLRPGDILFARRGVQATGRSAIVREHEAGFVCGTGAIRLRLELPASPVLPEFLSLILSDRASIEWFKFHAIGATMPNLNESIIKAFSFATPPLAEQVAIASVLGALDDKIDLNRRMNKTLEATAAVIFKDWLVDFGPTRAKMEDRPSYLAPDLWALFPDRLDEEGKPEGWQARPLDQIARFLNGLALQKYPSIECDGLPVIKIAQLRAGMASRDEMASSSLPADYIVQDGDLLFSWSGSLLHRIWAGGLGALNQHLFKVIPAGVPKWFVYCWIAEHMDGFRAIAASKATTMGHIQRHHLAEATAYLAAPAIIEAADNLIAPLFARMLGNDLEARTLAATRDLLLPKLMSGEVRVHEADSVLDAVA